MLLKSVKHHGSKSRGVFDIGCCMLAMAHQRACALADPRRARATHYFEASDDAGTDLSRIKGICGQVPCPSSDFDENGSMVRTTNRVVSVDEFAPDWNHVFRRRSPLTIKADGSKTERVQANIVRAPAEMSIALPPRAATLEYALTKASPGIVRLN